jgi:integrase
MGVDATRILTRREVQLVLERLHRAVNRVPSRRSLNACANLIIFRLSCCCGLRRCEIRGLNIGDMKLGGERPVLFIRKDITKGRLEKRRSRFIHLWWDAGTLKDLQMWRELRIKAGAGINDPFVCSCQGPTMGKRLSRKSISKRWRTAIKVLGEDRVSQLSVHCGRHSFASHYIYIGRSLVEVQKQLGHASLNTTAIYSHLLERENVPDGFDFSPTPKEVTNGHGNQHQP